MSDQKTGLFFNNTSQMQKSDLMDAVEAPDYSGLNDDLHNQSLAHTASTLLRFRSARMEAFENSGFQIDDVSFHILLDLVVSQNADQPKTLMSLAETHCVGRSTMLRYVHYMESIGLIRKGAIDIEDDQTVWVLTQTGLAKCNGALKMISREFENF